MLGSIFKWLVLSSVKASIVIAGILFFKLLLGKKLNAKWHSFVWFIVFVRLFIPWAPESQNSVFNIINPIKEMMDNSIANNNGWSKTGYESENKAGTKYDADNHTGEHTDEHAGEHPDVYANDHAGSKSSSPALQPENPAATTGGIANDEYVALRAAGAKSAGFMPASPVSRNTSGRITVFGAILPYIWLLGFLPYAAYILTSHAMLSGLKKSAKSIRGKEILDLLDLTRNEAGVSRSIKLMESEKASVPFIAGIIRPVILLPEGMADTLGRQELRHILLHELIHIKKHHNLVLFVAMVVKALHWFNPFIHLAVTRMRHDNEQYCDALELEKLGENEVISYGKTLVGITLNGSRKRVSMATALVDKKDELRKRIESISGFTKGKCKWTVMTVLVLALVACGSLNNEVKDDLINFGKLEPVELHFYTSFDKEYSYPAEVLNMLDEVSAALSDTIKVTPRFHALGGGVANFEQELKKLIDSGEQVDAFTVDFPGLFNEEMLLDITEIFRDYAPDYYSELVSNDYGMVKLEKASINGRLYCIPENEVFPPRYCVIARKDLADKYAPGGIETLENYADFLKAVKENEKSIIPGYVQARDFFDAYLKGNGYYTLFNRWLPSRWDDNQPSFYRMDKTPEFRQAFELLEDLNKNSCIFGDSSMLSTFRFSVGTLASELRDMHEYSIWNLSFAGVQEEYEVFPLYMDSIHALSISTYSIGISKSCRHPERVMMFIEWLHSSQEAYNLFMYGIKDRNYILQDGKIAFTADIKQNYYIGEWLGSWYFKDMRYERKFAYLPGNYSQLYIDAAFANTKLVSDEETRLGLSSELGEEVRERINQEYVNVSDIRDKITDEIYAFYSRIDKGRFDMTPGMLTEKLDGIGIERYQEYLEYYISEAKQE